MFLYIVNVSSSGNTQFKGIFLQAQMTGKDRGVGSWSIPSDGGNFRHVNCNEDPPSSLTHTNNKEKSLPLIFEWTAPEMWKSPEASNYVI